MKESMVLLVIDMQHGLLQREVYSKEGLIHNINELIVYFRKENMPIIFFRHTNDSFSQENSMDWQISSEIQFHEDDLVYNKAASSIFKQKQFLQYIQSNHISSVVVTGLVSNGCIRVACLDAKKQGLTVFLIRDGHSTFHKDQALVVDEWNMTLEKAGIELLSTQEFLSQ